MTDGMVQAIATVTVAFLGILVPLLTIVYKRTGNIDKRTQTQEDLLTQLCEELQQKKEQPKTIAEAYPGAPFLTPQERRNQEL